MTLDLSGSRKERRKMVADFCKREDAQKRKLELLKLARACDFVKWDHLMSVNRDWHSQIFSMSPELLKFTLNAQGSTLPSPSNLRRWGSSKASFRCALCCKLGVTAKHILSHCVVALKQGRYTFRHDNELKVLLPHLTGLINRHCQSSIGW